mmetsp:Transcript_16459/g.34324  ORF Transcript_16459/g.34324 Transcript_16459/m.34324 type:complete len:101 (-) Transcript_16459:515-817(-)
MLAAFARGSCPHGQSMRHSCIATGHTVHLPVQKRNGSPLASRRCRVGSGLLYYTSTTSTSCRTQGSSKLPNTNTNPPAPVLSFPYTVSSTNDAAPVLSFP